ncbi:MAG TPA: glycoside hydrolase family 99-like domain-containing protein [Candidatus Dormibacteraeota bacterium]|nr:glycoside hydrolase family 99-like domain-containing protein [Candidatus Dormibacteraeota bacterium]
MNDPASRTNNDSGRGHDRDSGPGESVPRAIAFYLPQYHPVPENDEWWGKGFTEWTNVVKAKPKFQGHYQPHLPADLGFYDLRVPEVRAAQADMAANYGIYGFCYYHYWFNGRRILERPVNEIWKSGEPDFPFCLCWANENWTRRWDGQDSEVLLEQRYGPADDLAHIRSLIPLFHDRRYIRVMDRPLLLVYRASRLPEPEKTTEIWRREAERAGLKGLFLARVESFGDEFGDPRTIGFDCSVEFQPRWSQLSDLRIRRRKWWHRRKLRTAEPEYFDNFICEYGKSAEKALADPLPEYPRMPCVCPGWDNSPRREQGAIILNNSTPEKYEHWLREVVNRTRASLSPGENHGITPDSLIFINAWNEWAEGNHLEPCQRWGRRYLEATQKALGAQASKSIEYASR